MTAIASKDDFGQLGQAMRALPNDRMRNFVRAYVVHPPGPGALVNSYVAAGYGTPDSKRTSLSKSAYTLSRDERIILAIHEEAQKLLRLGHPEAVSVLYEVMRDSKSKDRVRAASAILDRCDPLTTTHRVDVTHRQIDYEQEELEQYKAMIELGVSREKMREVFGGNTIPKLERRLAEEAKVIEGKVINEGSTQ